MRVSVLLLTPVPKLEGYRFPPIPFSSDGAPILPRIGEKIVMSNTVLLVSDIVWLLHHEVDRTQINIYVKEVTDEELEKE